LVLTVIVLFIGASITFVVNGGVKEKTFNFTSGNEIENASAISLKGSNQDVDAIANKKIKKYPTGLILENPSEIPEKPYPFKRKNSLLHSRSFGILDLPSKFNWRNYNGKDWTTSIKHQGCGDCWAFAALGTLESIINIRNGDPDIDLDLSEQYILSCLPEAGDCISGYMYRAFKYIMDTSYDGNYCNGVVSESCFPYQGDDFISCSEKCNNWQSLLTPILDYGVVFLPSNDEIKQMIVESGPVAASMDVYTDFYQYYDGIYEHTWGTLDGRHAVVIVGYDDNLENPSEPGYWICKNSWGTWWGEGGWFRIAYDESKIGSQICWVDYGQTTMSITIHEIQEIDDIDFFNPSWYYDISVFNETECITQRNYCDVGSEIIVEKTHIFGLNNLYSFLKIKLMENDFWTDDDLADISGYLGGGVDDNTPNVRGAIYNGYYDLINNTLTGDYTTILYPIYWYGTSGEYSPDGSTTTDENDAIIWFSLSDNYELPVAYIGSDQIANIGETVFFDASSSNSSDGSILTKYEWDWDSDSTYDESYVTPEANHIWNTGGNHTVVLKVTDNYGESSIDSCIVTINHAKPVALFTYAPLKPLINEFITFDASSSYDLDGIIEIYKWDWNNDGIYDASFTTPVVLHSFSSDSV